MKIPGKRRKNVRVRKTHRGDNMRTFSTFVYDNEDLLEHLRQMAKELGRTPNETDIRNSSGGPSVTPYRNSFGGLRRALELAGLPTSKPRRYGTTKGDVRRELLKFRVICEERGLEKFGINLSKLIAAGEIEISAPTIRKHYGSVSNALQVVCGAPMRRSKLAGMPDD